MNCNAMWETCGKNLLTNMHRNSRDVSTQTKVYCEKAELEKSAVAKHSWNNDVTCSCTRVAKKLRVCGCHPCGRFTMCKVSEEGLVVEHSTQPKSR